MIKILLIDDHAVVRNGIKLILEDKFRPVTFGEASNSEQAYELLRTDDWHLVLLDIRLPGTNGVEVLNKIKHAQPKLSVLILSNYPESQYAVRLLKSGASGYLSKDAEESEIVQAVKLALGGHKYISDTVSKLLANQLKRENVDPESLHEKLSNREYQVFLEIASGTRITDIAEKMNVSAKTVTTHRARILEKMDFSTNADIILYANKNLPMDNQ
ncbi:response regulator [Gilvimarinus chinensis]|uniref:response regulator n=1 Tax=Gilvimarinus chinensis TaxID=396005 RepID=UPI00037A41D1|nr:response regulator transcription factor [Gilvimarinus chinensis]